MPERVLTGIKPTGIPHLGNYFGAIRPALALAGAAGDSMFFIADYHALNQEQNPRRFNDQSYTVAATWLACGLDVDRSIFYRQSDIPEVFELATILGNFCQKSLMNKAHAYKAAVSANRSAGRDDDAKINMGLFNYPILMAADILAFDTTVVPVGKDQVQHVEIARDLANALNHRYRAQVLVPPNYVVQADASAIPGTDGEKMSKSRNNLIPLFGTASEWRKAVKSIATDSTTREEPKNPDASTLFAIFVVVAGRDTGRVLRQRLQRGGLGWGEVKDLLIQELELHFTPLRERFEEWSADRSRIDVVLDAGAARARPIAMAILERVRKAVGRSGSVRGIESLPVGRN
jgi:tryptophanyl-tRNA synthetase